MKEDPKRLIEYNNRVKQVRDEAEKAKPTESEDDQHDSLVGYMVHHEEKMTRKPVLKKKQLKKHQSLPSLLTQTQRTLTSIKIL